MYNPQQWPQQQMSGGGQYLPHSTRTQTATSHSTTHATGHESYLPSPPPPYTPRPLDSFASSSSSLQDVANRPTSISPNTAYPPAIQQLRGTQSSHSSPVQHHLPTFPPPRSMTSVPGSLTASPDVTNAPSFPPPPGTESNASRHGDGSRGRFSLANLTGRHRQQERPQLSAITNLQQYTDMALARASPQTPSVYNASPIAPLRDQNDFASSPVRPPASRRAASTGALAMGSSPAAYGPSGVDTRSSSAAYGSGMALPPPPPGPPPSSRSQSVSRVSDRGITLTDTPMDMGQAYAAPRQHPGQSQLPPIPPTPAGWTDEPSSSSFPGLRQPLRVDTSQVDRAPGPQSNDTQDVVMSNSSGSSYPPSAVTPSPSTGLTRQPARRNASARGIRERRSESRAARQQASASQTPVEPSTSSSFHDPSPIISSSQPADLVLSARPGSSSQQTHTSRLISGEWSGRQGTGDNRSPFGLQHELESAGGSNASTPRDVAHSTPRNEQALHSSQGQSPRIHKLTSSISPRVTGPTHSSSPLAMSHTANVSRSRQNSNEAADLNPSGSLRSSISSNPANYPVSQNDKALGSFYQEAMQRHRTFVEQESAARSDRERLQLFAAYIVNESRARRDRYSEAFEGMALEIIDLTRDLWRPLEPTSRSSRPASSESYNQPTSRSSRPASSESYNPPQSKQPPNLHVQTNAPSEGLSSAPSSAQFTPGSGSSSPASLTSTSRPRDPSEWARFEPSLSPIPSMAMSTVPDEENSRGRAASRWWEASIDGSIANGTQRIERTKRESKYMGLPLGARESLQWEGNQPSPALSTPGAGPSTQQQRVEYGPNEYPPEKVGWHEQPGGSTSSYAHSHGYSAPATPEPQGFDVSRLITLPPPFPRHYPALSNNHPDLAVLRNVHRSLSDLSEATQIRDEYRQRVQNKRASSTADMSDPRVIRQEVQQDYDMFSREVMSPLNAWYSERVTKLTASIKQLESSLEHDAKHPSPNQAQEEGDEKPELLERLTLLKWLFELREQMHRDLFNLQQERDELYKIVVLTPYRLARNREKMHEVSAFFATDFQDRKVDFQKEGMSRMEHLLAITERHVTCGVEVQLGAFWDIAPGLMQVVQSIPTAPSRLRSFTIQIPPQEYAENPSYYAHPLQYLYTLLAHAEKSAYQFIESQTNLLCLLHATKSAIVGAGTSLMASQRVREGEPEKTVQAEMAAVMADEESRVTQDLKEKVNLLEGQWKEALGSALSVRSERIEEFLDTTGGWDDSLRE